MLQKQWITWSQLAAALSNQVIRKELIGEILIDEKAITRQQVLKALAIQCGVPFIQLDTLSIEPQALGAVPVHLVYQYRFMPVELGQKYLTIAVSNPLNVFLLVLLSKMTNLEEIRLVVATAEDIQKAIQHYYKDPVLYAA
ncbi:MAG TPA: hypothetical protein VL688_07175 [Verrucomicrobiae bacterium]|nr:hypothetical protein [Verrucomicrobiae bacterium]